MIQKVFLPVIVAGVVLATIVSTVRAAGFDRDHSVYGKVLHRFVRDGLVDYGGLYSDPKDLNVYLDSIAAVSEREFQSWAKPEQLSLLINLYNAQTLRLIVDHYPVNSIKDIGTVLQGPWEQPVVRLFRKTLTLDSLEHGIVRKRFSEPRVHFALVCAAIGCPPLRGEPYVGSRLGEQLDDQTRIFLATHRKNRLDRVERVLYLSPIFKWFEQDFTSQGGTVLSFVQKYLPPAPAQEVARRPYGIRYTDYDWALNDLARQPGHALASDLPGPPRSGAAARIGS